MGRRSNPLGSRVGKMLNWPSNATHPMLSSYIQHIFQTTLVAPAGIRSSTSGIWVNVTLLAHSSLSKHPKIHGNNPTLDFRGIAMEKALGRLEWRTRKLVMNHSYYQGIFKDVKFKTLLEAGRGASETGSMHDALQIYR
jgi:hypothetical protein